MPGRIAARATRRSNGHDGGDDGPLASSSDLSIIDSFDDDVGADSVPPQATWLYNGVIEKKVVSRVVTWHKIRAVLTKEHLFFSHDPGDPVNGHKAAVVQDHVPLHEVQSIYVDPEPLHRQLIITTVEGGYNLGRKYVHRCRTTEELMIWHSMLQSTMQEAQAEHSRKEFDELYGDNFLQQWRSRALSFYQHNWVQGCIAMIICASFVGDCAEAQLLPEEGSSQEQVFVDLDLAFTLAFTLELIINVFSKSDDNFRPFYSDSWNLFDLFVVVMAIATKFLTAIPQLKLLRLVRIFRVARLFKKVRSLNRIINALTSSLVPVMNRHETQTQTLNPKP